MYIVTNEWKKEPTGILRVTVRWTDVCVGFYDSQESIQTKGQIHISMGDGGGHAVLNPKQPKPPIQKTSNQPHNTPFPGLKTPQNPSRITQQTTVLQIRIPKPLPINTWMPIRSRWDHNQALVENVWGQVGEEDESETWSGDWNCTCVVGDLAVDGGYVETTAETAVDWSHRLESERTVNYFIKKERICFCIYQTGPCNIVSIRNRSTYCCKKDINQRTNQPKKNNTLDLHALRYSTWHLYGHFANHSYLSDYHAWNQSSQLWKVHPVHRSHKQVWGHSSCFHRWFGMYLLYQILLLRRMPE